MTLIDDPGVAVPDTDSSGPGEPSTVARDVFGERVALAQTFADLLAADGVAHGHLGPREVPRIWDRHLVNSALLSDLVPTGARVVDVGSGAGLPGLAMAIRRPDLSVDLVEPMLRRVRFLESAVDVLGLGASVRVVRGRAESESTRAAVGETHWAVARAVARLDRLVEWCLPLLASGGTLLALKGSSAASELADCRPRLRGLGADEGVLHELGTRTDDDRTWVIAIRRSPAVAGSRRQGRARR